ncbi:prenylcysteine oxidase [Plakobranchus ocellatus]|uniref:Prenylcysteine oxidase n=1 Tax=Plakobranchus ocellatus TaxID=259542 RepID=A0AAV4CE55_9GAST|nr:prenylcysteine oxidase [Plakobranchus ocellatus]
MHYYLDLYIHIFILIGASLQLASARALNTEEDITPRIGIIGAGIGGTSSAYFLRQLFGPKVKIDVFESEKVGGRAAVLRINGQDYEAGASIISKKNKYMIDFAQKFNATPISHSVGVLGLYDENGIRFQTSEWKAITLAKLAWRYGMDLYTIQQWTENTVFKKFARIYEFQKRGMAFTTVEDMLRAMGEDILNMTHHSMKEVLKDAGLSQTFIDEFGFAAARNNYGQTTDIHGFVGAVAMVGAEPELFSIQGGNKRIPELLLEKSGANLIKGTVNTVALIKDELGSGSVSYELDYTKTTQGNGDEKLNSREYDIVIIAAPLEGASNKISFTEFPREVTNFKQEYHKIVAMFVQGKINITNFKVASQKDFPSDIFCVSPDIFFNSIGKLSPVSSHQKPETQLKPDEAVWKTFLNKVPKEEEILKLFESRTDLRLVEWLAYPEYHANMDLPPFMLYDRLYYVNAIESAAAAMEMNVIGAHNVALLAHNQWHSTFEKIDEIQLPSSSAASTTDRSDL